MLLDRAAKFSGRMRMYVRYAELLQRPCDCIMESSIPWEAAVVAAPLLKLWPEYKCACIPALAETHLQIWPSVSSDSYVPEKLHY